MTEQEQRASDYVDNLRTVETLRTGIKQLREYRDQLDAQNRTLLQQKNAMQAERDDALTALGKAVKANCDQALLQQLTHSQARESVMRQRLEELLEVHDCIDNEDRHQTKATKAALSADSGKSFLAQYREMRTLLDVILDYTAFIACPESFAWQDRREAVLEVSKGLV